MDLIYTDEFIDAAISAVCRELEGIQQMLSYYHQQMNELKQEGIISGETAEAIEAFDHAVYGAFKGQYHHTLSTYFKTEVNEFAEQVDKIDGDLY